MWGFESSIPSSCALTRLGQLRLRIVFNKISSAYKSTMWLLMFRKSFPSTGQKCCYSSAWWQKRLNHKDCPSVVERINWSVGYDHLFAMHRLYAVSCYSPSGILKTGEFAKGFKLAWQKRAESEGGNKQTLNLLLFFAVITNFIFYP